MKKVCLVRLDDFCPTMDFVQFQRAFDLLDSYNIKPLIGVIPDNQDEDQIIDSPMDGYWVFLKKLQDMGYDIAMHGYTHVYDQESPKTLICGRKHSEFAGNSFEVQLQKILDGKKILNSHGLFTDFFFAPAHSYDKNTLKALKKAGFIYISDGLSSKPYFQCGVKCLPCRSFGVPLRQKKGIAVAVCHPSEWGKENKKGGYDDLARFCNMNSDMFISFSELKEMKAGFFPFQKADERIIVLFRRFKQFVKKILRRWI